MNQQATFDRAAALARVDGDLPFLQELARLFLSQCGSQMEQIVAAVASRDAQQLMRAAHSLKGSLGNLSAANACEKAQALETKGKAARLDGIEEDLAGLTQEMDRLCAALSQLIAETA